MCRLAAACHRSEALRRLLAQRPGEALGAAREGEEAGGLRSHAKRPFGVVSSPSRAGTGGVLLSTAQQARAQGGSTRATSGPSGALSRPRHGAGVGGAGVEGGGARVTTGRGCHALGGGGRLSSSREVGRSGAMPSFSSGMRGSARSSGGGGCHALGGGALPVRLECFRATQPSRELVQML
jgi:hypothetical protein